MPVFVHQIVGIFESLTCTFGHTHNIIMAEYLLIHFLQVSVQISLKCVVFDKIIFISFWKLWKERVLGRELKCIKPKSIYAFIRPKLHHVINLLAKFWVLPI